MEQAHCSGPFHGRGTQEAVVGIHRRAQGQAADTERLKEEKAVKFGYAIVYVDDVPVELDCYHRTFGIETRFLHGFKQYGELETPYLLGLQDLPRST